MAWTVPHGLDYPVRWRSCNGSIGCCDVFNGEIRGNPGDGAERCALDMNVVRP